jgi:hypothetical protein
MATGKSYHKKNVFLPITTEVYSICFPKLGGHSVIGCRPIEKIKVFCLALRPYLTDKVVVCGTVIRHGS